MSATDPANPALSTLPGHAQTHGHDRIDTGSAALDLDLLEDAYYEVDIKGRLRRTNRAARELLGYDDDQWIGKIHHEYMKPEVAAQVGRIFARVFETGEPTRGVDWTIERPDGGFRFVEGSITLARDTHGNPSGFRGIMRDVTARRQAEQALRESEARFRALTDLSSDWYWEQDDQYRLTRLEGRSDSPGYNPGPKVIGKCLWDLPTIVLSDAQWTEFRTMLERRQSFRDFEYAYLSARGMRHYVSMNGAPVFDQDGVFAGYRGTSREITERKNSERMLALEHRVTDALAHSQGERDAVRQVMRAILESENWDSAGYFELLDEAGNARMTQGWSNDGVPAEVAERHRRNLDQPIPPGGVINELAARGEPAWIPDVLLHPRLESAWRETLSFSGERALFAVPIRVEGKAVSVFGFSSRNMLAPDERQIAAMRVIASQFSQFLRRRRAEKTLRDSEARFRALTHLSSDWYWELDAALRFSRIGGGNEHERHRRAEQATLGRHPWELGMKLEPGKRWADVAATMRAHESFRDLVVGVTRQDGSQKYISVAGEPISDEAGKFCGYRGIARNITEQVIAEQRIQYMATHDSLTGLPNRTRFDEILDEAVATEELPPFAVMFIDLDGFKSVNDTLGHEAGDTLLHTVATRVGSSLREGDVVARLGGDEFIVMLADIASDSEVRTVAEKIGAIVAQPVRIGERSAHVTSSIGIARYPEHAGCASGLIRAADLAMYEAKRAGKNRHAFFSDLQPGASTPGDTSAGRTNRRWAPV